MSGNPTAACAADIVPPPAVVPRHKRLAFIDVLRAIACGWVLLCHFHSYWLDGLRVSGLNPTRFLVWFAGCGGKGVDLFIVLSGFCLYYAIARRSGTGHVTLDSREFFQNRARRILPGYYAALAACLILLVIPWVPKIAQFESWTQVIPHLLLIQNLFPGVVASINGSFWTLALELQLYLFFPLILSLRNKLRFGGILAMTFLLSIGWLVWTRKLGAQPATAQWEGLMDTWLPARWFQFVGGMLAAELICRPIRHQSRWALGIAVAVLPFCVFSVTALGSRTIGLLSYNLWGLFFACLVVVMARVQTFPLFDSRPVAVLGWIGMISYSLYLIHQPFLLLTRPLADRIATGPWQTFALFGGVALPILLSLAYLFFLVFEKPFMRTPVLQT